MIDASDPLTRIRNLALAMPEAIERRSDDGACAFLIDGNRAFARYRDDGRGDGRPVVLLRTADGQDRASLIESDPDGCYAPDESGWIGMCLDRPETDWDRIGDRIAQSWELTAPGRLLEAGGR